MHKKRQHKSVSHRQESDVLTLESPPVASAPTSWQHIYKKITSDELLTECAELCVLSVIVLFVTVFLTKIPVAALESKSMSGGALIGIAVGAGLVRAAFHTKDGVVTMIGLYIAGFTMLAEVGLMLSTAVR